MERLQVFAARLAPWARMALVNQRQLVAKIKANPIPQWRPGGLPPAIQRTKSVSSGVKIGRNEPCSCGSGKSLRSAAVDWPNSCAVRTSQITNHPTGGRVQSSFETNTPSTWKLVDKRSRKRLVPSALLDHAKPGSPTAFASISNDDTTKKATIGCYAITGRPCPANGWWRSEEPQALEGTRWFAKGSLLPAATFNIPSGVFGTSTDAPKVIQRRAKWRLVRLAHAPEVNRNAEGDPGPTTGLPTG